MNSEETLLRRIVWDCLQRILWTRSDELPRLDELTQLFGPAWITSPYERAVVGCAEFFNSFTDN